MTRLCPDVRTGMGSYSTAGRDGGTRRRPRTFLLAMSEPHLVPYVAQSVVVNTTQREVTDKSSDLIQAT